MMENFNQWESHVSTEVDIGEDQKEFIYREARPFDQAT